MNSGAVHLNIQLLGPLTVELNTIPMTPSAPKQRQVLALLALNAGRVVTVSTLIEELWGDHPPRSYATTLQTYILQIRNALAAAMPDVPEARGLLSTRHSGYALESGSRTDVEEFSELTHAGRMAAEAGDHRAASEQLGRALRVWRGPALVDVTLGRVLELEAASLEETRLGFFERRVEADLALGRHNDLLGELTLASARNPMNEILSGYLMLALYRSGHVGRALEVFHRLGSVLDEELGVAPCARMQRLHAAMLAGDPALESSAWTTTQLYADLFSRT